MSSLIAICKLYLVLNIQCMLFSTIISWYLVSIFYVPNTILIILIILFYLIL